MILGNKIPINTLFDSEAH